MPLTLPTASDLFTFWGDDADDDNVERADMLIELAANLLWLGTGLEDDPTDLRLASLVKLAILDMAIHIYITRENIDAEYSPFVSERIGSYSYSKTYSKLNSVVSAGQTTGAVIFDELVAYLSFLAMGSWADSEFVFAKGFIPLYKLIWPVDPFVIISRQDIYSGYGFNRNRSDY